jgi:uncharacterized protein (DUF697 family)
MSSYESGAMHESELGELGELGEFSEFGESEFGETEFGETGQAHEQFLGSILGALTGEVTSGLSEAQESELASELLEVSGEQELEQFLGNVFKKVVSGVGNFVRSPVGQALGGVLKSVAKKALPIVGGALGSMVAPGVGTAIGSKLGSMASGLFEFETQGMSAEQAEFEVARRIVRLAASSARNAAAARPVQTVNPRTVARAAVARAARQFAPGIYRRMIQSLRPGTWQGGYRGRPRYNRPVYGPGPVIAGQAPVYGVATPVSVGAAPVYGIPSDGPGAGAPVYGIPPDGAGAPVSSSAADQLIDGAQPTAPFDAGSGVALSGRWVRRGRKIIVLGA